MEKLFKTSFVTRVSENYFKNAFSMRVDFLLFFCLKICYGIVLATPGGHCYENSQ
jgi:hypothetical protein